jgi:hypothetical protein
MEQDEDELLGEPIDDVPKRPPGEDCNARRTDDGEFVGYCDQPAGWRTDADEGRCRAHGGASTGPKDTSHLQGNDYAAGNPGGGAPEGNANAEIHGGFSDWRKAYDRFDEDAREHVEVLAAELREQAAETAPEVPAPRRDELTREKATLMILEQQVSDDVWCNLDGSGDGRGLVVEKTVERNGETVTVQGTNPAVRAETSLSRRQREIAEELQLFPGFRDAE